MTLSQRPSPLDIMTLREVRDANESGAGVAALDQTLGEVLWANRSGRLLLGLAPEPADDDSLPSHLPVTRQIKAAARLLSTRGEARLLLRTGAAIGAKPVVADLKRLGAAEPGFVILTVETSRRPMEDDAALASRLLHESGLPDAAIHSGTGLVAAGPERAGEVEPVDMKTIDAFLASDEAVLSIELQGSRTTYARVASRFVLLRSEAIEAPEPAAIEDGIASGEPMADSAAESETPGAAPHSLTGGFFSVRRRRLPTGRGPINMNALVERWHSRQAPPFGEESLDEPVDAMIDPRVGTQASPVAEERRQEPNPASDHAVDGGTREATAETIEDVPETSAMAETDAFSVDDDEGGAAEAAIDSFGRAVPDTGSEPPAATGETARTVARPQPLRSLWGAPARRTANDVPDPGGPAGLETYIAEAVEPAGLTEEKLDEANEQGVEGDPTAALDATAAAESADDGEPALSAMSEGTPSPVLSDVETVREHETAQPIDGESEVILPDLPPEEAADLEQPLSIDLEVPASEPVVPDADDVAGVAENQELSPRETVAPADGGALPVTDAPATHAPEDERAPEGTVEALPAAPMPEPGIRETENAPTAFRAAEGTQAEPGDESEDLAARAAIEASFGLPADRPPAPSTPDDMAAGAVGASDRAAEDDAPVDSRPAPEPVHSDDATSVTVSEAGDERSPETTPSAPSDEIMPSAVSVAEMPEAHGVESSRTGFEPRFDVTPVRFVWQIDSAGRFKTLSPEFAAAVGPKAADVVGRSFQDVAQVFGFDAGGEIARLLDRRDTWSGRSIFWPIENSDRKVPVDLAALPVYAADRSFDGFRGFGILRMSEAVDDADAVGLVLAGRNAEKALPETAAREAEAPEAETAEPDRPVLRTFASDMPTIAFGRRQEPPVTVVPPSNDAEATGTDVAGAENPLKVIRLEERRRPKDGVLSQAEEAAFRAIGMKLGTHSEAESPGALRFADAQPPGETQASLTDAKEETAHAGDRPALAGAEEQVDEAATAASTDAQKAAATDTSQPPVSAETAPELDGGAQETDIPVGDAADDEQPTGADPAVPSVAELDAIFGSLPLPVIVQASQTLIYANREFAQLTGHDGAGSVIRAGGLDALFVEPKDSRHPGELSIRHADGGILDVRAHMQRVTLSERSCLLMSFSPTSREEIAGTPTLQRAGATEATCDVMDSPADEAAFGAAATGDRHDLSEQIEELQAVLDTATDGIVLLDPAGLIRSMNGSAQALFGTGQTDQHGHHLSSLFAHESQKATHDYLDMLRDNGLAGILNDGREVIGRVAQGGFIPLFITIGRLSGERGWCVVIRDIAHWKRIEEDLVNARRQAEAASLHKSRFLANISHELRTPLNAIIGFADVMASECFGPIGNERYLEYLNDIKRSGHHVLDLVNDLLDISKIEAGKLDLAFEAVSLNEVVSEVVSLMQPQANRERVIVRSNLPSSVPPVVADRRTMRQIALNLVANAIRFTPAGGQIIASTTYTAEGDVVLRFRDSGIGMTDREIEIALTPFQQVHSPSVNRGEGTGLGLPLTKAMVEANRAAFAIHSTPGEGTLVEISFPSQRVLAD